MPTPYQAIVSNRGGRVTDVLVCDQATADLFQQWDMYPGCSWHDVTDVIPRPAPGWSWAADRSPEFRPPAPGPGWTWNDETGTWDVPAADPEPEPSEEPDTDDGSSGG